jgi:hypothetical protein
MEQEKTQLNKKSDIDPVIKKLSDNYDYARNKHIAIGLIVLFIGVIFMLSPFSGGLGFYALIPFLIIAVPLLVISLLQPPSHEHPILLAIQYHPEKITAFYLEDFKRDIKLFHITWGVQKETRLAVQYLGKKTYRLPVKKDWYEIREYFKEKCPHAYVAQN